MIITPHLITYKYYSKNIGNTIGQRSTIIITAEEDGYTGYAEIYAATYHPTIVFEISKEVCSNQLPTFISESGPYKAVANTIDIAKYDLKTRQEKKIFNIDHLNLYASAGSCALSAKEIKEEAVSLLRRGFSRYKLRVGKRFDDKERVSNAINVFGSKNVAVDFIANSIGKIDTTLLYYIDQFSLLWLEEPYNHNDIKEYKCVNKLNNQVVAGEWCTTYWELESIVRATGNFQVDFSQAGISKNICNLSKQAKITAIHSWGSNISFAMAKMAYNMIGNIYIEHPIINSELNKYTYIEDVYGLGVSIDKDWLTLAANRSPVQTYM